MKFFSNQKAMKAVKVATVTLSSLMAVAIVGNEVSTVYAKTINKALNCQTTIIVKSDDDTTDTNYFPSDYSTNTYDENGNAIYTQEGIDRMVADAEQACVDIEGEGLVMLKNDGQALPLAKNSKVSLFGQGVGSFNYSSFGSSAVSASNYANLKTAAEAAGLTVNTTLWDFYTKGEGKGYQRDRTNVNEAPWSLVTNNCATGFADFGDAAVVVISRNSGEGTDVPTVGTDGKDGNYLALSQNERDMLAGLTSLKKSNVFKKIIVVINSANALQMDFLKEPNIEVDACMWAGNVGKTGIYAITKAMVGDIVPSGRLTDTYVYDNFSSPAMASWKATASGRFAQKYTNYNSYSLNGTQYHYGVYTEGIYVGYRYYETRYEDTVLQSANVGEYTYNDVVAYPFGYGLSYAQFSYSQFSVEEKANSYEVTIRVTNNSNEYDGKEVVQVYLQKAYDASNALEASAVELVGYTKTGVIAKGGYEDVTISVDKEQLKAYDTAARDGKGGYVLEKGDYYLAVGANAHDAVNNVLSAKKQNGVSVNDQKMTAQGNADLTYRFTQQTRDEATYALSKETNNPIQNQFDFADINRYEGRGNNSVTYVSRADWAGTFPKQEIKLTLTEQMVEDLGIHKELPTETTETLPTYGENSGISLIMLRSNDEVKVEYNDGLWNQLLDQMTFQQQSMLLSNAAFGTVSLSAPINKPETKDNDGPTGVVGSKTKISFPSEGVWASSFNNELIAKMGDLLAEDARYNGFTCLYATGINIHRTPYGGRVHEYFSEDAYLTGAAVTAEVKAMQAKGVIPTLKHFAFNDEEDQRGGIGIWLNEQEAREIMLKPFEMAMRPSMGNAHGVMTSFNRAGCIWTSASPELMINVSRQEWDFDGYSITDMAESFKYYMTYDDGIMNGTDTFLAVGDEDTLSDYSYSIPFRVRMREASHRVLYVTCNFSAAMNGMSASSRPVNITPAWQLAVYWAVGVLSALTAIGAVLWAIESVLQWKRK